MPRYRSSFNHSEEQKRNLKVDLRRIPEWEEELESIRNHFRRFDLKQVRSAGWLINRRCKDLHLYGIRSMYHREYERKIERWKYSLPIDDLCSFAQSFVGFGKEIKKSIQSYLRHTENRLAGFREKGLTNSFWVSLFTSKGDAETLRREEQTKTEYLALSQEIPEVEKAVKLLEEVIAETCGYSSSFHFQQSPLHFHPALKSAECSVGADSPVTGDDDGKRVMGQGGANGPGGPRITQMPGYPLIGTHPSPGNSMFGPQDLLLERGTQIETGDVEGEAEVFPGQEGRNPVGHRIDRGRRRRNGIREQGFDHLFGRKTGPGEQDAPDLRLPLLDRPQDGHRTEPGPAKAVEAMGYFYCFKRVG
jgi:hypothetical protein